MSAIVQLPQLVSTCGAFALWCHSGVITWGHEGKGGDSNDVQDQLKDVKKVVAAYSCLINDSSFAALTNNGQVVHWGGQYEKLYPNVASDLDVVDLSATSCALALILSDGTVMTWGDPEGGGDSSAVKADLIKVHSVVGTVEAFAAVRSDGKVITWGSIPEGDTSTVKDQLQQVRKIVASRQAFAAILETGGVVAWGVEFLGGDVRVPYAETVHKLQNVKDIRAAAWAFAALLGNGTVVAWGNPGMGGDYLEVQDQLTDVCSVHATSTAFAALSENKFRASELALTGPRSGMGLTLRDANRNSQKHQMQCKQSCKFIPFVRRVLFWLVLCCCMTCTAGSNSTDVICANILHPGAYSWTTTKNLNATVSGDVVGLTHNISCNTTALSRPKSFHWPQVDSENVQGFNKKVEQSQPQDKTTQFCKLFGIAVLVCLIYCTDNEGTPEPFGHRKTIKKKHKKHRHKHHAPSLCAIQKIRPARMCGTKRVKAPRLRTRCKARHFWLNRVVPKYGTKTKRKNIQEACNPPNWRHFAGGHGGGSATTKRKREERQNTSLADMLQETLSAWQQQQQQQGHWKSPKKKQQRQTHTTQPPESGLLSTLEAILQQCRQRQDDDNAVAEAIQHALQTHSDSDQTGQKDTKNDNSWYKKEGSWSKKWEDWDQQWWQWYDRTNTWDTAHYTHDEGSTQDLPTASIQELRFQEWTMRPVLLHLQTLKKGLTTGEKVDGNIIHLSTPQQVVEAQSLWAAYNLSGQVTFLLTDSAKDTPGAYHTRATCTRKHQRPRLENISLLEAAKGGRGPWTHPPVQIPQSSVKSIPRTAVRVTAPSHFRAHGDTKGSDRPQDIMSSLATTVPGLTISMITGGPWWSETVKQNKFLHTVVKVPSDMAEKIVQSSGYNGVFACKLGEERSTKKVHWHKREPQESHESYLRRMLNLSQARKEGLKLRKTGPCDLGLLCTNEDEAEAPKHNHWISTGYPIAWQTEEVLAFLEEQGWSECSIISRKHNRRPALPTWWVRAIPPSTQRSGQDSFEYILPQESGDAVSRIFLHKAPPKAIAANIQYVPGPKKQWKETPAFTQAAQSFYQPNPKKKRIRNPPEVDATQLDSDGEETMPMDTRNENSTEEGESGLVSDWISSCTKAGKELSVGVRVSADTSPSLKGERRVCKKNTSRGKRLSVWLRASEPMFFSILKKRNIIKGMLSSLLKIHLRTVSKQAHLTNGCRYPTKKGPGSTGYSFKL